MEIKNRINNKTAFHCDTKEKAMEFIRKAHELGYNFDQEQIWMWISLNNIPIMEAMTNYTIQDLAWEAFKSDTCFILNHFKLIRNNYLQTCMDDGIMIVSYEMDQNSESGNSEENFNEEMIMDALCKMTKNQKIDAAFDKAKSNLYHDSKISSVRSNGQYLIGIDKYREDYCNMNVSDHAEEILEFEGSSHEFMEKFVMINDYFFEDLSPRAQCAVLQHTIQRLDEDVQPIPDITELIELLVDKGLTYDSYGEVLDVEQI